MTVHSPYSNILLQPNPAQVSHFSVGSRAVLRLVLPCFEI
jgi:hypothetical protein